MEVLIINPNPPKTNNPFNFTAYISAKLRSRPQMSTGFSLRR